MEKAVPKGVEVEACEGVSKEDKDVKKEEEKEGEMVVREGELVVKEKAGVRLGEKGEVVVKVEPQQVANALAQYAADLRAIEARAKESVRVLKEQERAFQEQFAQVEGLVTSEEPTLPVDGPAKLIAAAMHERELTQMWEREELAKQQSSAPTVELVIREPPSQAVQNSLG